MDWISLSNYLSNSQANPLISLVSALGLQSSVPAKKWIPYRFRGGIPQNLGDGGVAI